MSRLVIVIISIAIEWSCNITNQPSSCLKVMSHVGWGGGDPDPVPELDKKVHTSIIKNYKSLMI